jgi:hypothetical protein
VIKARRIRWAGQVARTGRTEKHTGFWWVKIKERDHLEDLGIDGRIILRLDLKKSVGNARNGLKWLRIGTSGVLL